MSKHRIEMTINGRRHAGDVDARVTLSDFLRDDAGYTGVHVGCEHGVCGACTVIVDGKAVRSCLMLAVQADGAEVRPWKASPRRTARCTRAAGDAREHALQCGFCTPGVVMTLAALTMTPQKPSEESCSRRCPAMSAAAPAIRASAAPQGSSRLPRRRTSMNAPRHRRRPLHRPARAPQGRPPPAHRARPVRRRISLPGMLHVAFARSAIARGKILLDRHAAAREMPGVHAIYTQADLPTSGRNAELLPHPAESRSRRSPTAGWPMSAIRWRW